MKKLSELEIKGIIDDYKKNLKIKEIACKYQILIRRVFSVLRKRGIPSRLLSKRPKFNENIFENIDNQEKAYWLGFLMADGYVTKNRLGISLKDGEMIYKFRSFLGNDQIPIVDRPNCKGVINQKCINIYSPKLIGDVKKYGLIENKVFRTQILNIPENYIKDFIRGYFDGDGCLYKRETEINPEITISSCSQYILLQIQTILQKNNIIRNNKNYISKSKNCSNFRIRNTKEAMKFLDFIYQNSTIYLPRKYIKYINIKNTIQFPKRKNKTSKYLGVSYVKLKHKFVAAIGLNGKQKYLGTFKLEQDAAEAYNNAAKENSFPDCFMNKIIY